MAVREMRRRPAVDLVMLITQDTSMAEIMAFCPDFNEATCSCCAGNIPVGTSWEAVGYEDYIMKDVEGDFSVVSEEQFNKIYDVSDSGRVASYARGYFVFIGET